MSIPSFQQIELQIGKMLMVHQAQGDTLGNFSHVLLDGKNFQSEQESRLFTEQATSTIWKKTDQVFTYIDHEGGRVHRFNEREVSALPSAYAIRLNNNPEDAFTAGELAGQQLAAIGITMSLGPVVDIGPGAFPSRCFGTSAEDVFEYANLYIDGLKQFVLVCLKHWPGHGAVLGDSHHLLPHATDSIEILEKTHFKPFIALAEKVDAIMTAHIVEEKVDPHYPATFSTTLLSKLRENHFNGVIISDSMSMHGAKEIFENNFPLQYKTAILAGCNLLILGRTSLEEARNVQKQLAQEAIIDPRFLKCIEDSVNKIEAMLSHYKASHQIHLAQVNKDVRTFGKRIAQGAMRFKNTQMLHVFNKVILFTPELLKSNITYGFERAFKRTVNRLYTWKNISPTEEEIDQLSKSVKKDRVIIIVTFNSDREPLQQKLVNHLFSSYSSQVCLLEANYSVRWSPPSRQKMHLSKLIISQFFSLLHPQ